jgi:hypothetical protein
MRTTDKIRRFRLAPALLLAAAGVALSAAGCVIDNSSPSACQPLLTAPWQVVDNATNAPITCATAGAAGGSVELDLNGTPTTQACPAAASGGEFDIGLAGPGSYTLDAFLFDSHGTQLSEVHPPVFSVSCADTVTPTITFPVNL